MRRLPLVFLVLLACGDDVSPEQRVLVTAADEPLARAALTGIEGFIVEVTDDPAAARSGRDVALVSDGCEGCYQLFPDGDGLRIEGGPGGGLVYGITAMLEGMGYRFPHPTQTVVPESPRWPPSVDAEAHAPEIALRGLHLHTLHPIESLEPAWLPGEENLERMKAIVLWIARQNGNFVRWVGLDDIQRRADLPAWQAHTQAINEHAHTLGMETALAIQLFGSGNLQNAFDLVDDTEAPMEEITAEMRRRLQMLAPVGFDQIGIAFGEFFNEEPERFIRALTSAAEIIREEIPGVEVTATIHVGDSEEQKVIYMGEEMIYYFLARFAPVLPFVHTVMYYALDDDTGGAYHHENWDEHRDFILAKMAAGEPVIYFPETAYWVAWDNSIPMYMPVYAKVRHHDLELLGEAPGELTGHVLFSSGWEWGYWQNDRVALRSSYARPARWVELLRTIYDDDGLLDDIEALADLQHEALVEQRLGPYLAGRDAAVEVGFDMGILGQPDRVEADELVSGEADAAAFRSEILPRLVALADAAEVLSASVAGRVDESDVYQAELRDGFAVFALRARFVVQMYEAALRGVPAADAQASMDAALPIVTRRHENVLWSVPETILANRRSLPVLYDYGYLREASTLCFWRREMIKLQNALDGASDTVPLCFL